MIFTVLQIFLWPPQIIRFINHKYLISFFVVSAAFLNRVDLHNTFHSGPVVKFLVYVDKLGSYQLNR